MPFRPHWSVLCDFDGTIGLLDTIDTLLHRFGQPGWKPLEEDWLAGRMGSGECMRRQVALLDMDADEFADTCPRSTSTPPFPPSPQQWPRGWPLEIVSDGLDQRIRILLARSAVTMPPWPPMHCTERAPLEPDLATCRPGCAAGTCKCARRACAPDAPRHTGPADR
jgi:hypothetical protein